MRFRIIPFFLALLALSCAREPVPSVPEGRGFGLHFDFHASPEGCPDPIGGTLKEDDIREICESFGLDFLQVDCKGHPGWVSYPTKIGNAMPGIVGDPMKTWRKVTDEEGVELYVHYSGVYETRWCRLNPGEATMNASGGRTDYVRPQGPYVDEVLIPQMLELAGEYGIDGCWIDGDCWGAQVDYDPRTIADFEKETGADLHGVLPTDPDKPYYYEYRDYLREVFCRYLRHYTDAIHEKYPDFKVCSNWSFSDHMPVPVCADVDFLSADLAPFNSVNWARYAGRSMQRHGLPWDLMAWAFRANNGLTTHVYKDPVQLMQEGAAIISLGGGYQMYITQLRDGSPRMDEIRKLTPVAGFIKERLPWTLGGKPVPQVAVFLSSYDALRENSGLYNRANSWRYLGLVALLCDCGHSVSIISEQDLQNGNASNYPVIVVPEFSGELEPQTMASLKQYTEDGGSVILTGEDTPARFAAASFPVTESVSSMGKGKVVTIPRELSSLYSNRASVEIVNNMRGALDALYEPDVEIVSAVGRLELTELEKDGMRCIQLVNANGSHSDDHCLTEDCIPPLLDISLRIRCDSKPASIWLEPEGRRLKFTWTDGCACVEVPRVDMHSIVVINQ